MLGTEPLNRFGFRPGLAGKGGVPMKRETRRTFREFAYYSSLGFSVSLAIFIGLGIGVLLDRKFDTSPWLTLIFLALGIAAGFRNIALVIKRVRKT
jgi:ATP synthase protein I